MTRFLLLAAILLAAAPLRAGELDGIEHVYDQVLELSGGESPVVCLVDTEHPDVVRADIRKRGVAAYKNRLLRQDLERLSAATCFLLHYTQVTRRNLLLSRVKALVITARQKWIRRRYDDELAAILREATMPVLGICGAHQFIATAFGGRFGPMRRLESGQTDPRPEYWPGQNKEWGFYPIRVLQADPLFDGLGPEVVVREFHAFEVTQVPTGFEVLASTDACRVQAFRHQRKPLYGTQFHPERYDSTHPDGERILKNFLRLAGFRPGA